MQRRHKLPAQPGSAASLPPERLHARVVKVFALLAIAPLILGALISLVVSISLSQTEITSDQHSMALNISEALDQRWHTIVDELRASALVLGQTTPETHAAVLETLHHSCDACQALWLVDRSGKIEQQVGTLPLMSPLDPQLRAAIASGSEAIPTNPPASSTEPTVLLAFPVPVPGKPPNALLALVNLQQMGSHTFRLIQNSHSAYAYVTDRSGRLIISPRPDIASPGTDLRAIPLVNAALLGQAWEPPNSESYTGLLVPFVDGVWQHIPDLDWFVLIEGPPSISSATSWYHLGLLCILLILTGTAALVIGRRLAATITRPIEQLHRGVTHLQSGHWDQPPSVQRQDEIGQLATAFNSMARELHTKHLALISRSDELELANRELQIALEAARSANLLKSQFVATISHELRTPLTSVLGFADMLEVGLYGTLNSEQHDVVIRIRDNGWHLLQLINDLLDFSKLEAGKLELYEEQYSFPALVSAAVNACEPLVRTKGLTLHVTIDRELPIMMYGDSLRLRQILLNLLSNAVKFTKDGSVSLHAYRAVRASRSQDQRTHLLEHMEDTLVIEVTDTGIGIAPEDHTSIFELFRQVDANYTRRQDGTGLGLAITQRLVELMHGTIGVVSHIGAGSRFTITLPLKGVEESVHSSEIEVYDK